MRNKENEKVDCNKNEQNKASQPLFSVILPLFNKEKFIKDTVYSILNQSFPNFELIIVNDGSTDKSLEVVNQIDDYRIKVITKENSGVAAARNSGLMVAQGEFIAFIDADDLWEIDYLSNVAEMISQNSSAGFYCSKYIIRRKNGNEISSKIDVLGVIGTYWELLKSKYDIVWTSATVIRKSLIDQAGLFYTGDSVGEDLGLWTRVAALNPDVMYNPKVSVTYIRDTPNNARVRNKILFPSDFLRSINGEILKGTHTPEEIKIMTYKKDKKTLVYILSLIANEQQKEARKILKEWDNGNFSSIKIALILLSYSPHSITKAIFSFLVKRS